jgi:hypothetical protein
MPLRYYGSATRYTPYHEYYYRRASSARHYTSSSKYYSEDVKAAEELGVTYQYYETNKLWKTTAPAANPADETNALNAMLGRLEQYPTAWAGQTIGGFHWTATDATHLTEDVAAAGKLGVSYGQYMVDQMWKTAGGAATTSKYYAEDLAAAEKMGVSYSYYEAHDLWKSTTTSAKYTGAYSRGRPSEVYVRGGGYGRTPYYAEMPSITNWNAKPYVPYPQLAEPTVSATQAAIETAYQSLGQDLWAVAGLGPTGMAAYYGVAMADQFTRYFSGDYQAYASNAASLTQYYFNRGEVEKGLRQQAMGAYYGETALAEPLKAAWDAAKGMMLAGGVTDIRAAALLPAVLATTLAAGAAEAPYLRTIGELYGGQEELRVIQSAQSFWPYQIPSAEYLSQQGAAWGVGTPLMRAAAQQLPVNITLGAMQPPPIEDYQQLMPENIAPSAFAQFPTGFGAAGFDVTGAGRVTAGAVPSELIQPEIAEWQAQNQYIRSDIVEGITGAAGVTPAERPTPLMQQLIQRLGITGEETPLTGEAAELAGIGLTIGGSLMFQGAYGMTQMAGPIINLGGQPKVYPQLFTNPALINAQVGGWLGSIGPPAAPITPQTPISGRVPTVNFGAASQFAIGAGASGAFTAALAGADAAAILAAGAVSFGIGAAIAAAAIGMVYLYADSEYQVQKSIQTTGQYVYTPTSIWSGRGQWYGPSKEVWQKTDFYAATPPSPPPGVWIPNWELQNITRSLIQGMTPRAQHDVVQTQAAYWASGAGPTYMTETQYYQIQGLNLQNIHTISRAMDAANIFDASSSLYGDPTVFYQTQGMNLQNIHAMSRALTVEGISPQEQATTSLREAQTKAMNAIISAGVRQDVKPGGFGGGYLEVTGGLGARQISLTYPAPTYYGQGPTVYTGEAAIGVMTPAQQMAYQGYMGEGYQAATAAHLETVTGPGGTHQIEVGGATTGQGESRSGFEFSLYEQATSTLNYLAKFGAAAIAASPYLQKAQSDAQTQLSNYNTYMSNLSNKQAAKATSTASSTISTASKTAPLTSASSAEPVTVTSTGAPAATTQGAGAIGSLSGVLQTMPGSGLFGLSVTSDNQALTPGVAAQHGIEGISTTPTSIMVSEHGQPESVSIKPLPSAGNKPMRGLDYRFQLEYESVVQGALGGSGVLTGSARTGPTPLQMMMEHPARPIEGSVNAQMLPLIQKTVRDQVYWMTEGNALMGNPDTWDYGLTGAIVEQLWSAFSIKLYDSTKR